MGWLCFDDSQPSGQEYQFGPYLLMEHVYDTVQDPTNIDSKRFFRVENQMVQNGKRERYCGELSDLSTARSEIQERREGHRVL